MAAFAIDVGNGVSQGRGILKGTLARGEYSTRNVLSKTAPRAEKKHVH
jgi:hypothetical protein